MEAGEERESRQALVGGQGEVAGRRALALMPVALEGLAVEGVTATLSAGAAALVEVAVVAAMRGALAALVVAVVVVVVVALRGEPAERDTVYCFGRRGIDEGLGKKRNN